MRKTIICILGCLLLAACVKKVPEELPPLDLEGHTIVEASIESLLLGEDSRTWPEGAAVGVSASVYGTNEKYLLRKADANLSEAVFYGPEVTGEICACYPWDPSYTGSWGRMTAALDNRQEYTASNGPKEQFLAYSPMAFGFESAGKLSFEYPFGILSLRVALEEELEVVFISTYVSG